MTLRKNSFSNIIWIFYSIVVLAFSALLFSKTARGFGVDAGYGLLAVPIVLAISIGIVFLSEKIRFNNKKSISLSDKTWNLITYGCSLVFIIGGLILRVNKFNADEYTSSYYFDNAFIVGNESFTTVHGATSLYYFLLRCTMKLFGNHLEPLIMLQIVLQTIAFIILFFALKKMSGNIIALTFLGFGTLSGFGVKSAMTLGPSIAYLLLVGVTLLCMANMTIHRDGLENNTFGDTTSKILAGIIGLLCGLLIYFDIAGLAILVYSLIIFCLEEKNTSKEAPNLSKDDKSNKLFIKEDKSRKIKLSVKKVSHIQDISVLYIIFLGAMLGGIILYIIIDLANTSLTFSEILKAQFDLYKANSFSLYSLYEGCDTVSGSILSVLLILGIPGGFRRRKTDQGTFIFLVSICLMLLTGFSLISKAMDGAMFILLTLTLLAGETLIDIFSTYELALESDRFLTDDEKNKLKEEKSEKNKHEIHKIEDGEMLDNPLPVPEKKVRKKMDYDYFIPDEEDYDY